MALPEVDTTRVQLCIGCKSILPLWIIDQSPHIEHLFDQAFFHKFGDKYDSEVIEMREDPRNKVLAASGLNQIKNHTRGREGSRFHLIITKAYLSFYEGNLLELVDEMDGTSFTYLPELFEAKYDVRFASTFVDWRLHTDSWQIPDTTIDTNDYEMFFALRHMFRFFPRDMPAHTTFEKCESYPPIRSCTLHLFSNFHLKNNIYFLLCHHSKGLHNRASLDMQEVLEHIKSLFGEFWMDRGEATDLLRLL